MKKWLQGIGLLGAGALAFRIWQQRRMLTLFQEGQRIHNFRHMDAIFKTHRICRAGKVYAFERDPKSLKIQYAYLVQGEKRSLDEFLERTETTGFIVVKDDKIVYEKYFLGELDSSRHISWSVGKSFVSALVGIALAEGTLNNVNDRVVQYLPELGQSGYRNVTIKNLLQMCSGIAFKEDYYPGLLSPLNWFIFRIGVLGEPFDHYLTTLRAVLPPGSYNRYRSMDTEVLGMLLRRVTGGTLSEYLEEKIWRPLGMEADALWITDEHGNEMALGGLNCTLRDYARFGRLYLNEGKWGGEQIIPEQWVRDSTTPDAPHLQPGLHPRSDWHWGYGYNWWIPEKWDGDFMGIGIWGQFLYVYPKKNLVMAKTSVDPQHEMHEDETLAAFRAVAAAL